MTTETSTHENLQAIAYAALAEAQHNVYAPSDADVPAEPDVLAPDLEDARWATETNPNDTPSRQATLMNLDPRKVDQIYQTMPNFEEWDTHRLIAWFYAIDFTLRERLA